MIKEVKFSELANFSLKQKEAHEKLKKHSRLLYGGAVGGGKSYWLRWELIYQLLQFAKLGSKNVVVGLFCENYPALKDRHLSKISKDLPDWIGTFHADHKEYGKAFILRPEYGSGVIAFRNLDDAAKYQSAEFAVIAIDELTKNEKNVFDDLITRLRWPALPEKYWKFIAATNPGGIGHAWVKKWWIDRDFEEEMKPMKDDFIFIPAKAEDNPHIAKEYLKSLDGLPEDKRRAFRDGDWDIFKGQYFSEFRREIHVVEPFEILQHFKKFICLDYGYSAPSAVYWCFTDQDGVIYIYRELYETNLTYERLAQRIISLTGNEKVDYLVADPAIWAKKGETDLSGAEIMQQVLDKAHIGLIKGNNDRINGWSIMREYLKPFLRNNEKIAKLQVFSTCVNLVRTLPSLVYDKYRVEDLDTDGEDHGADAVRYGIMSRPVKSPGNPKSLNGIFEQIGKEQQKVKISLE